MKKIFILLIVVSIGLQFSCEKKIDVECVNCYCVHFVEPFRLSYQNKDSLDLLRSKDIIIDSIIGHIYFNDDTILSEQLLNMEYDIRRWVGLPQYQFKYFFIELDNELVGLYDGSNTKGIGMDHEFYIYTNIGIDTINVRWDILLTPVEECCNDCISFPHTYLKCNNIELTEGTKTGAAIIRK